jgi:hypothetical protein
VLILDYEFAKTPWVTRPRWEIVPEALPTEGLHCTNAKRVLRFEGIKEDVYAPDFKPDPAALKELGLRREGLIITVRPAASEAHYHNPESEALLAALMTRICRTENAQAVLLPRNRNQEMLLRERHPEWFADGKVIVPQKAMDGLNLLWFSDLVVSGGGTMNREAAALGIPVYSIFRGKMGAVDKHLEREGRLTFIETTADVEGKILFRQRPKDGAIQIRPRPALHQIVDHIEHIIQVECAAKVA